MFLHLVYTLRKISRLLLYFILFRYFQGLIYFVVCFLLALIPLISLYPLPRNHHTVVHVHESFFFFLVQSLHPLVTTFQELSDCSLSISLSLFFLLVQFIHYLPHKSEIIWYLSFSDRFISSSIIFSRSIHAIAKSTIFFSSFFMAE